MYNICTKFERKLTKHVQDTTQFQKKDDCQSAIFDPIVKQNVMDMYPNMYKVCTTFKRKLTKHVQDITVLKIKMAASQPSLLRLRNKLS